MTILFSKTIADQFLQKLSFLKTIIIRFSKSSKQVGSF